MQYTLIWKNENKGNFSGKPVFLRVNGHLTPF